MICPLRAKRPTLGLPNSKNIKATFGKIDPSEYDTSSCKEYKKLLQKATQSEEKLMAALNDEQKELFFRYTEHAREFQTTAECLLFQSSFKLGARMMLEVLGE